MDQLSTQDFYREAHQTLFAAMIDLHDGGKHIDLALLADALDCKGILGKCGGSSYLITLMDSVAHAGHQQDHIDTLVEKTKARMLLTATHDFFSKLEKTDRKPDEILSALEETILSEAAKRPRMEEETFRDTLAAVTSEAISREAELFVDGLSTGFSDIDYLSYGLGDGELIVVAARPSMGKTQFALCVAWNVASDPVDGGRVDIFSIEMSKRAIGRRYLSLVSGIPQRVLRLQVLPPEWKRKADEAYQEVVKSRVHVHDCTSGLTPGSLRRKLRKIVSSGDPPKMVVIDYLQLMTAGSASFSRNEEMDKVSRELKKIAEEFHIPVMVMAQLNREVEKRSDKRPVMSDVRESGGIENNADQLWMIHLPAYYWKEKVPASEPVLAEIIIAKARNSEVGIAQIGCLRSTSSFYQPEEKELYALIEATERREADERDKGKGGKELW